ncbi:MAG: hypothetical protein WBF54_15415 [Terriglobales bacterium]
MKRLSNVEIEKELSIVETEVQKTKTPAETLAEHTAKLKPQRRNVPAPDPRPRWQGKLVGPASKQSY